jgi:hypothetical protein
MKTKCLAIGIILFLIGIAIVPSIDANTPVVSSNGELVVVVLTDKDNYQMGEHVVISIYVENHGNESITIRFGSTKKADYQVNNAYLWSAGKVFLDMIIDVPVPSGGRVLLLRDSWRQINDHGNQVSPGTYRITGWMVKTGYYPIIYAEPVNIKIGSELNIGVHGGIGVNFSISNIGIFNATNVSGEVSIKGGILGLINLSESYSVDNLAVNESILKTLYPLGFGPITIEIYATASDAEGTYLKKEMSVIILFVYQINPSNEIKEANQ